MKILEVVEIIMTEEEEVNRILRETREMYMKGMNLLNQANEKLHHAHYKYPNNPAILLALAASLASTGNIRDPIEIYNKVLKIDGRNIYALVGLAKLKFELNDIKTAVDLLKTATEVDPNMYEAQMLYCQIHLNSGNIQEAKRMVEHILSQNPDDEGANLLKDRILHLERGD